MAVEATQQPVSVTVVECGGPNHEFISRLKVGPHVRLIGNRGLGNFELLHCPFLGPDNVCQAVPGDNRCKYHPEE